ncbi:MAG: YebC/PmpR family DNA-binding transcriptional regulator [Candidatus Kerfeldbacteria bacterium]|nr:YebC/PmpR family DNA-binding transcriptional regulator [Candidatus Kerfeldbacteria bacterium]
MSGHSKWAQIKRQKGVADQKKGALFTKLGKAIALAARKGGADPDMNVQLRLAVDKAKSYNMPASTIERAISRASGADQEDKQISEVLYEGYGPGGVAILIEATTDNRNRTSATIRQLLSASGGKLAAAKSVQWMFGRRGVILVTTQADRDAQELALIDAGADDLKPTDEGLVVEVEPDALLAVRKRLEESGQHVAYAQIEFVPTTMVDALAPADAEKLQRLIESLEDDPDVNTVATNDSHA